MSFKIDNNKNNKNYNNNKLLQKFILNTDWKSSPLVKNKTKTKTCICSPIFLFRFLHLKLLFLNPNSFYTFKILVIFSFLLLLLILSIKSMENPETCFLCCHILPLHCSITTQTHSSDSWGVRVVVSRSPYQVHSKNKWQCWKIVFVCVNRHTAAELGRLMINSVTV